MTPHLTFAKSLLAAAALCAIAAKADQWNTSPPATTTVGTYVGVNYTATYPSGTPPTWVALWVRNPSGTWIKIACTGVS
jgi:hypothetical protein